MPLVAGIDASTQSTKVELRDLSTGAVVGAGQAAHPLTVPPRSEQEPSAWWSALGQATAQALAGLGGRATPGDIAAVAVAGQQHGLVALDQAGRVLRPAKLWNDTESAVDADRLVALLGPEGWARACGSVPTAAFTVTKLAWLRRCEPDVFRRLGHALLPHDWLNFRLTHQLVTDRGDASGTGYWSPAAEGYRFDLLDPVDPDAPWPDIVPPVAGPRDAAGALVRAVADELGLPVGTPVAVGTGDNMAGALGVGLQPGQIAVSIGTSGTVYAPSAQPTHDASGAVAGFADATGGFLPLVCLLNAALVTSAIARLFGVDHATLDTLALSAPAGADGVTLVPYLAGERTPNRPGATGSLLGIRSDVDRPVVARAAYEGVVCALLEGLDALVSAGVGGQDDQLLLLGGGARSVAYRQVLASLSGRPVSVPSGEEIVSAGACVQAASLATGSEPGSIATAWGLRQGQVTEPDLDPDTAGRIRARFAEARG